MKAALKRAGETDAGKAIGNAGVQMLVKLLELEPKILPGTSNQEQTRRSNPLKQKSCQITRMESDKTRESRPNNNRGHSAAEGRPVRSRRKPTGRHLARIT
ncbi:hypothetical protein TNCV_1748751 [Trichonephila clavipes]|nr:hypothetical protein TNCV_1748751 [Trichonephila clavipes]